MPTFAEHVVNSPQALERLRQAYLKDVTEGGTWGAEVEARHLARIFRVHLVFWTESEAGKFRLVHQYNHGETTLHLLGRGSHFEALRAAPTEGEDFHRATVVSNLGGGDCLYRAFHQAWCRNSDEPSPRALSSYRGLVAQQLRMEGELDLEGLLVTLLDEVEMLGFAFGAGPTLQREMRKLYREFRARRVGGGSIPPFGRAKDASKGIGTRDPVPRKEMSIADRLLDRIGRLVATADSVHVALALDDKALVVSMNDDTAGVLTALDNLLASYGSGAPLTDPHSGSHPTILRVPRGQLVTFNKSGSTTKKPRRNVDLEKIEALRSGKLELLTGKATKDKLQRIKAALVAGRLTDKPTQTAKEQYLAGAVGLYFIPHVPRTADTGVVHGEMSVTAAIQERRTGKNLKDDVFVGGTLIDCFDCNQAHLARNEALSRAREQWRFYSGGTHGNSFPGWYLQADKRDLIHRDTFLQERFPTGLPSVPWWHHKRPHGKKYGYDEEYFIPHYYYWRGGMKQYVRSSHDRFGRPNLVEHESQWQTVWQSAPRTCLTDLFLRHSKLLKIVPTHSSFADDSDSDTEDYDDLILQKDDVRKEQRLKLRSSYAEGTPDLEFFLSPEASLPFSFEQVRRDPLMVGALVQYTGPTPTRPRLEFYLAPDLLDGLRLPDWVRQASTWQGPPGIRRGVAPGRTRPMLMLGALEEGETSDRVAVSGALSPGDIRRLLEGCNVLPSEAGDGGHALVPLPGEGLSFNLGQLFDLFWMLAAALGMPGVALTRSFDDVLDRLFARLLKARERHGMEDGRFVGLMLVVLYLRHVLTVTGLGPWTLEGLLQAMGGRPRADTARISF